MRIANIKSSLIWAEKTFYEYDYKLNCRLIKAFVVELFITSIRSLALLLGSSSLSFLPSTSQQFIQSVSQLVVSFFSPLFFRLHTRFCKQQTFKFNRRMEKREKKSHSETNLNYGCWIRWNFQWVYVDLCRLRTKCATENRIMSTNLKNTHRKDINLWNLWFFDLWCMCCLAQHSTHTQTHRHVCMRANSNQRKKVFFFLFR